MFNYNGLRCKANSVKYLQSVDLMYRQGLPVLLAAKAASDSLPLRKLGQPKRCRRRALTPKQGNGEAKLQADGKDAGQNSPSRKGGKEITPYKQSNPAALAESFYGQISRRLLPFLEWPSRLLCTSHTRQRSQLVHDRDYEELIEAFKAGRARAAIAMCEAISHGLLDVAFAGWVCFHKSLQNIAFSEISEDPALLRRLFLSWACMHRVQKSVRRRRVSVGQSVRRVSTSRQSVLGMICRHENQLVQQVFVAWAGKEMGDRAQEETDASSSSSEVDSCFPAGLENVTSELPTAQATTTYPVMSLIVDEGLLKVPRSPQAFLGCKALRV